MDVNGVLKLHHALKCLVQQKEINALDLHVQEFVHHMVNVKYVLIHHQIFVGLL